MTEIYRGYAPFAYDTDYYMYTEQEEAKKKKFLSFHTQREASYKKPAEEIYNNKHLEEKELFWGSFRENIEPPTPQIKEVDGYKSEEEISHIDASSEEDCGDDKTDSTNG